MPCHVDWPNTSNQDNLSQCQKDLAKAREEADRVTKLLCQLMKVRDNLGGYLVVEDFEMFANDIVDAFKNKELQRWWKNHQKVDAKRIAKEAKAKKIEQLEAEIKRIKEEKE